MTKSKTTKRALIISMISLLVCVSMLIGTTYAWFTDSVTSGGNQIVAGNLDIELYHKNATLTEAAAVQGATNLFPITLWEPGVYSYEVFTIKNVGNLALKYTLNALVTEKNFVVENGVNTGRSLLDVLYVKVLDDDHAPTERPAYSDGIRLKDYLSASSTNASGHILPSGADHTATIVVYWPQSDNDNDWNLQNGKVASDAEAGTVGALTVKFAVNLVATQYTHEADSFDNQYDAQAEVPGASAATPISTASEDVTLVSQTADGKVLQAEVPAELAQELSENVTSVRLKIDPNPETETTGEITTVTFDYADLVDQNDNVIDLSANTNPITVTLALGSSFANAYVSVYHDGELKTTAQADANGNVTYTTTHFCEITVKRVDVDEDAVAMIGTAKYASLGAAINDAYAGDTILLLKDVAQDNGFIINKSMSLDTNGKTITVNNGSNCNYRAFKIVNGTFNVYGGGLIDAKGQATSDTGTAGTGCYGAFRAEVGTTLILKDLTLKNYRPWGLNIKILGATASLDNVTVNSICGGGIEVTDDEGADGTVHGYAKLENCNMTQYGYRDHCSTPVAVSGNSTVDVYSTNYSGEYGAFVFSSGGIINIYGGTWTAEKAVFKTTFDAQYDNKAIINVYGGSFSGDIEVSKNDANQKLNIYAGTFVNDPTDYRVTGATVSGPTDGIWTVTGPQTIGPVGGDPIVEGGEF